MSKVYVDCGSAYEPGWYNVDGLGTETPIGKFCDAHRMPCDGQAEIVRVRRVFERLADGKIPDFLADIEQTLKPGGRLELCIIDHDPAQSLASVQPILNLTMFGPNKNYTWHVRRWEAKELAAEIGKYGLEFQSFWHDAREYPCIWLAFTKPQSQGAAKDYAINPELRERMKGMKILEIGPGRFPLPGAHTYLDIEGSFLTGLGQNVVLHDINSGLPFKDKEFDFIFCSHVLEHCKNPAFVVAEMNRVAPEGMIIMPSIYKEFLFGFEEDDHIYEPIKIANYNTIILKFRDETFTKRFSKDYKSVMCKMYREGRYDTFERQILRKWFRENEVALDLVLHWKDHVQVQYV